MRKWLYLLVCLFTLSACMKDKYDLGNVDMSRFAPTVATPLINSSFSFESFLGGLDTLDIAEKDENGLIHFIIRDTLFTYDASEILVAPDVNMDQGFDIEPIALDAINSNVSVPLYDVVNNMGDSMKTIFRFAYGNMAIFPEIDNQSSNGITVPSSSDFSEITLSQGRLGITITNNWPADLTNVQIELVNTNSGTVIDTFIYAIIETDSAATQSTSLAGETLEADLSANIISMSSPGSNPDSVLMDSTDALVLDIDIDSIEIISGTALFPTQELMDDSIMTDFNLGNGEVITAITLKGGSFNYDFTSEVQEASRINIAIPGLAKDNVPFDIDIDIAAAGGSPSQTLDSVDLTGYVITPSQATDTNGLQINITASIISSGGMVYFDTSQSVSATIDLKNLEIAKFEGDLGDRSIALAGDTTEMSNTMSGGIEGMKFYNPSVSLNFVSSMGVPLGLDLSGLSMLDNSNTPYTLSGTVTTTEQIVDAPATEGDTETTVITIDRTNSNIADLMSAEPQSIITAVTAGLNPGGETDNFVLDTSKIELTMDMDIPLTVTLEKFSLLDTMEVGEGMLNGVKLAEFVGSVTNGFPVDLDIQIYFMDNNYVVYDSLISGAEKFANAAEVDASGNVTATTVTDISIEATEDIISAMNNAMYLLVDISLNTPNNGDSPANFISTYEMDLQLGLRAQASIGELTSKDDE